MERQAAIRHIRELLGDEGWITAAADLAPWLTDSRQRYHGRCIGMARPATVAEVAEVIRITREAGLPVVPQGGNTGRGGGATPDATGNTVLLNLARLNRIRAIDPANDTMLVEAGCILQDIQQRAAAHDRLFPLSLGAEGSCQIGGNLATNAGGIHVLRYGNARDLVLGLEVVLPDGRIWNGLRGLRKDNSGYDLKQIFLGSEGTLGVITAAVLKLFPRLTHRATALVALHDLDCLIPFLDRNRAGAGELLYGFELIPSLALEWAAADVSRADNPLGTDHEWTVLLEWAGAGTGDRAGEAMQAALQDMLAAALESGEIADAIIAQSEEQRRHLWFLREAIVAAQSHAGPQIKHDIAVPVSRVPEFIRSAGEAVAALIPGIRPCPFGHAADGNIHYNLSPPADMNPDQFRMRAREVSRVVHEVAARLDGTFSAEHGIGRSKREAMARFKPALEIELQRGIKRLFDPRALMNPGVLLPDPDPETEAEPEAETVTAAQAPALSMIARSNR